MSIYNNPALATNMQKFAFTLVDNRKDQHDYMLIFSDWIKRGCNILYKFAEHNKHGYVHYHGLIEIPKTIYRKTLCPKGYSVRFKEVWNAQGWYNYCKKDQEEDSLDTDDNDLMDRLKKPLFLIL